MFPIIKVKYQYVLRWSMLLYILKITPGLMAQSSYTQESDSLIPTPRRPFLAAGEVIAVNAGVWAFDRYVIDGHYARISLNTMEKNLKKGFYWDNDNFMTNLFNHPYHGSIYFNAARSNGMNFWESGIYTLGGSAMWELFMECELPSTNDLVATTFGGIALGETFHRVSDMILDNRTSGWNRFGREALGFILSPGKGLTRVITGEAWKRSPFSGKQFFNQDVNIELSVGFRMVELFELESELLDEGVGICLDARLEYGNLYETEDIKPYDYFTLHGSFNFQKKQPIIGYINLMGRLWNKKIHETKKHEFYLGAFQHFDYYDSDTLANAIEAGKTRTPYEVGTPASAGMGLLYKWENPSGKWKVKSQLHFNGIVLGSSLSDYYRGNERKYNWGSGYAAKWSGEVSFKDKFHMGVKLENYHIFTWRGYDPGLDMSNVDYSTLNVQGDKSNALYDILSNTLRYDINKKLSITYERYDFFRKTYYTYLPDIKSTTSDSRVMVTYKF